MQTVSTLPAATPAKATFHDYLELTKPRLSLLSVITALVGYLCARPAWSLDTLISLCLGTSACAAGVAALNQLMEHDTDARMARTADRPIPAGKIATGSALVIGWLLCGTGLAFLHVRINSVTSLFGLLTIVTYLAIYTPAKRWSRWSTEVGAVAGAFPPLIGWAAAENGVSTLGWILFALLFLWQIPHFMAIAWTYRADYAAVHFPLLPVRDTTGGQVARWSLVNTVLLIGVAALPWLCGLASLPYLLVTLLLGAWFIHKAAQFLLATSRDQAARALFLTSIAWLPLQLAALVLDRTLWSA